MSNNRPCWRGYVSVQFTFNTLLRVNRGLLAVTKTLGCCFVAFTRNIVWHRCYTCHLLLKQKMIILQLRSNGFEPSIT